MSNVIPFPTIEPIGSMATARKVQMTRREYLEMAKMTLDSVDYEQLLLSIMDPEYYEASDDLLRQAADDYYDLPNSRME